MHFFSSKTSMNTIMASIFVFLGFFDSFPQFDIISLIILVVIGIIIIMLVRLLLMFIPAVLLAIVVWIFTGSLFWAGITFLVVATLSFLKKL